MERETGETVFGAAAPPSVDQFVVALAVGGRPKNQGVFGTPMFSFVLPQACECGRPFSVRVEDTLEVHSPGVAKGRALLFRAGRELTRGQAIDGADLALPAEAGELAAAKYLQDQQQLSAQYAREIARQNDERDALSREIVALRQQRDTELTRNNLLLEKSVNTTIHILDTQSSKLEAQFISFWNLIEKAGEARLRVYETLNKEGDTVLAMRARLDEVAKRDFWAEAIKIAEKLASGAADSALADAISFQMALALHERAARKNGGAFDKEQALAAAMMQGKGFRRRLDGLRKWAAEDNHPIRKAAEITGNFLLGAVSMEELEKFLASQQQTKVP